ncbi:hypothetical protein [uncultured Psychroserpens sp.]|uniref:hypothetical protein n=1 Tax=uncultured Psychroserpens sp. TaxID=255436 RepID=UPI00260627A7|nr:hypothetical protein [uncultured Psychroserpens sp.]
MQVINIHKRKISQPKEKVSLLFKTLATSNDHIWPYRNWPAMRFKDGLKIGSNGGHGRIRYTIIEFEDGNFIKFKFRKPDGFYGTHELSINAVSENTSEIIHKIDMKTSLKASVLWVFMIRWLHDALIEDAFDNVENYFSEEKKTTPYNVWVKVLRTYYKSTSFKTKHA